MTTHMGYLDCMTRLVTALMTGRYCFLVWTAYSGFWTYGLHIGCWTAYRAWNAYRVQLIYCVYSNIA